MTKAMSVVNVGAAAIEAAKVDGTVWINVKRVCDAIGLSYTGQYDKLSNPERAHWATIRVIRMVAEDGKDREVFCLDLERMPMWLATIDVNRVSEQAKPILIDFQNRAANILRDHFFPDPGAHKRQLSERRLQLQIEKAEFAKLSQGVKAIQRAATVAKGAKDLRCAYILELQAAALATGQDMSAHLPAANDSAPPPSTRPKLLPGWSTTAALANELGVSSAITLGKEIASIGLRTQMPNDWRQTTDIAPKTGKRIERFEYSPAFCDKVRKHYAAQNAAAAIAPMHDLFTRLGGAA